MRVPRLQFGLLGMSGLIALMAVLFWFVRALGRESYIFLLPVFLAPLASCLGAKPSQAMALSFLLGMIGGWLALAPTWIEKGMLRP